jgi:magnesium transporter
MAYTVLSYSPQGAVEHEGESLASASKLKDAAVWVDLNNPSQEEINELGAAFGFHQLALDDCMHEVQRPKLEVYEGYLFVVARHVLIFDRKAETKQIAIFLGKNYLVSVHSGGLGFLDGIKAWIKEGTHRINNKGPDYLLYKILDAVVDNYFNVLDSMETEIECIERDVVRKPSKNVLRDIFRVKKNLIISLKPLWPLREVMHTLQSGTVLNVSDENMPYFRDVYDHLINALDMIETHRELVTASMEAYLSSVSNSLNEVVKVLTVGASLFMLPMLIASIYGMNFKHMPELDWDYGYVLALFAIAWSIIFTYAFFRKKRWV